MAIIVTMLMIIVTVIMINITMLMKMTTQKKEDYDDYKNLAEVDDGSKKANDDYDADRGGL